MQSRARKVVFPLVGVSLAAAALLIMHNTGRDSRPNREAQMSPHLAVNVNIAAVRKVQLPQTLELSGTVRPVRTATLATRVSGRITALAVEEGDHVRAGQPLVAVDVSSIAAQTRAASAGVSLAQASSHESETAITRAAAGVQGALARVQQLEAQFTEARAAEAQARSDQKRTAFLFRGGAIARADLDHANTGLAIAAARVQALEASISQARADVGQARAGLQQSHAAAAQSAAAVQVARTGVDVAGSDLPYGTLVAPFAGAVTRKLANLGDLASPGKPMLVIEDLDHLYLEVSTPEEVLRSLLPGLAVRVRIDSLGRTLTGRVHQVIPSADPQTRTFTVKVRLPHDRFLVPGVYGRVSVRRGFRETLLVPEKALMRRGQLVSVFVVIDDVARLRLVKVGSDAASGAVEALAGLAPTDRVVVDPPGDLQEGARVRVEAPHANAR